MDVNVTPFEIETKTSWTNPDPKWMAGVTTIDRQGIPHHVARVVTYTTAPLERDREFTGQGVLHLHASSDQTDMDVIVKVSLLPVGAEKPPTIRVTQGWLRASHRAVELRLCAIVIDGTPFKDRQMIVALGIGCDGRKTVVGLREGATENTTVVSLLSELLERGVDFSTPRLYILDGGKALAAAVRKHAGEAPAGAIQGGCEAQTAKRLRTGRLQPRPNALWRNCTAS
jgi:hypothetical protein